MPFLLILLKISLEWIISSVCANSIFQLHMCHLTQPSWKRLTFKTLYLCIYIIFILILIVCYCFFLDVTKVKYTRPPNFKYLSGQWVRLSCTAFGNSEYHSLTLTSAPHENYLSVHVKAQGPWTWKLRNYFDPNNLSDGPLPKVSIT